MEIKSPSKITRAFTRIDGLPVAIGVAPYVIALKILFFLETGIELFVNSGVRTYAEQEAIFRLRYVRAADINGRRVYDVRWWQGVPWYRISSVGTVAAPGSSNHETGRSIDFGDRGPYPTVASSFSAPRNIILRRLMSQVGFTLTGLNFGEPWHGEQLQIADPWMGQPKPLSISPSDPGQILDGSDSGTDGGNSSLTIFQEAGMPFIYQAKDGKFAGKHYSIAPGFIAQIVSKDTVKLFVDAHHEIAPTKEVILSDKSFRAILAANGIPEKIFDGSGLIMDYRTTGKFASGNSWMRGDDESAKNIWRVANSK